VLDDDDIDSIDVDVGNTLVHTFGHNKDGRLGTLSSATTFVFVFLTFDFVFSGTGDEADQCAPSLVSPLQGRECCRVVCGYVVLRNFNFVEI